MRRTSGRDVVESSWCHCAEPVRERIPLFGCHQCALCGRPFRDEALLTPPGHAEQLESVRSVA